MMKDLCVNIVMKNSVTNGAWRITKGTTIKKTRKFVYILNRKDVAIQLSPVGTVMKKTVMKQERQT